MTDSEHPTDLETQLRDARSEIERLREDLRRRDAEREETEVMVERALNELRQISSEWRETLDALSELVILLDEEGAILRINRTAEVWGIGSVRELPGQSFHDVLHPRCTTDDCFLLERWRHLVGKTGERPSGRRPPGLVERELEDPFLGRRLRLTARRLEGAEPGQGGPFALLVLRDVTIYHHRQVTLTRREQLEAMGHLVRGLAHEIGNPLAAMKTSIQVLVKNFDRFPRDKQEAYLERIVAGSDRIQKIIDRVLSQQSEKIGPVGDVQVVAVFHRLVDLLDDEMRERRLRFEVVPPEDPDLKLLGDADAVETVLAIVLDNAMDACEPGGRIQCRAFRGRRWIQIEVCDTGSGIRRGDIERVFQPFFSTKSRGSGIGMSHAHHLIEQMGGRVELTSSEGEGTSVSLTFKPAASNASDLPDGES